VFKSDITAQYPETENSISLQITSLRQFTVHNKPVALNPENLPNKKRELMLMRHANAYSSSGSVV